MLQQITIETIPVTTDGIRNTGPLVQSVNDPYSMIVEIMSKYERVTVPGIVLHDPEFAGGYAAGRALYFDEVNKFVDQAGNVVTRLLVSQIPFVKSVKVRDITDQDATNFIAETMFASECDGLTGEPIPLAWKSGLVVGYTYACLESALGLHEAEDFPRHVTCETAHHRIEVHESCLTIGEHQFPDRCVSLSPEETDQVLEVLQVAQSGMVPFPSRESGEGV